MKILLASGNNHKKEELNKILKNHTLILPAELGITMDVEETGSTFLENSIIKAEALFELSQGLPVLADDSGIVVDALNGAPGIYSARYGDNEAGRILSSKEKYEL
ncbi:MAG: non-canonical purine NTP pyrophosphatase, partial [Spirochaetaceae bacterium 4572_7]